GGAMDEGMWAQYSMPRRSSAGPEMSKQGALRAGKLHGPRRSAGQIFDASRERHESRGDDRTGELRDVRGQLSDGAFHVRLDQPPFSRDVLRESRERLQFVLLAVAEFRTDALCGGDRHPLSSPMERNEIDVRPGVDH